VSRRDAVHAGGTGELMLAGRPDAFRANSTSSERRLTRVVSPRPVYGDLWRHSGTLAHRSVS
jgi:hypothetical protein